MNDKIIYTVVGKGGGVDGKDHTDKGGKIWFASYDRREAEKSVNKWSELKPQVVDIERARQEAISKLNPLDRLVLGLVKS